MDIPFKLTCFLNKAEKNFNSFSNDYEEALKNIEIYSLSCNELQDMRIQFMSDKPTLDFWIEIMDMLPKETFDELEIETGRFNPSEKIRGMYLNVASEFNPEKLEYSTLLPGIYKMVIRENKIEKYFAFLKVESIRINEEQLLTMRNEVEDILSGLAKEVATKRKMGKHEKEKEKGLIYKYHFLISNSDKIISNINQINKNPKFNLEKIYNLKQAGKSVRSDSVTIKNSQTKTHIIHKNLSYDYILNYEIAINSKLKYIVNFLLNEIIQVESYLEKNITNLISDSIIQRKYNSPVEEIERKLEILYRHQMKVRQLKSNCSLILKQEWLSKVRINNNNVGNIHLVPNYRVLNLLFNQMNQHGIQNNEPLEYYIYSWKETSKLYEIWGFLKIILLLKNNQQLNISHAEGWIFDDRFGDRYPFLEPGTIITFKNEYGLKLRFRYDAVISNSEDDTDILADPLFTIENNNRPDFRLDVYQNEIYKGSIIADFKYRAREKLGNKNTYIGNNVRGVGYKVYSQLLNYTYGKSFYLNKDPKSGDQKRKKKGEFSVKAVFGIFPKNLNTKNSVADFMIEDASNITRCAFSPGYGYERLIEEFIEIITDMTADF